MAVTTLARLSRTAMRSVSHCSSASPIAPRSTSSSAARKSGAPPHPSDHLLLPLASQHPPTPPSLQLPHSEEDFEDIDAERLADPTAHWPAHAARAVKKLVCSTGESLCHQRKRKRLALSYVYSKLTELLSPVVEVVPSSDVASADAAHVDEATPPPPLPTTPAPAPAAGASELSLQVRKMRKGDSKERLQRNTSNGFDAAMRRLAVVYAASAAAFAAQQLETPAAGAARHGFEEQINFWHAHCGMHRRLKDDLHTLRRWRNASDHHDAERWRRDGPSSESVASELLARVEAAASALETGAR